MTSQNIVTSVEGEIIESISNLTFGTKCNRLLIHFRHNCLGFLGNNAYVNDFEFSSHCRLKGAKLLGLRRMRTPDAVYIIVETSQGSLTTRWAAYHSDQLFDVECDLIYHHGDTHAIH